MICYSLLSSYLIETINTILQSNSSKDCSNKNRKINIIDVFGVYETSKTEDNNNNNDENSSIDLGLNEFFINYFNEKLRQIFYEQLLENSPVEYQDNSGCVHLGEKVCQLLRQENTKPSDILSFIYNIDNILKKNNFGCIENDNILKINHYSGISSYSLENWFLYSHYSNSSIFEKLVVTIMSSSLIKQELPDINFDDLQSKISCINFSKQLSEFVFSLKASKNHFIYCLRSSGQIYSNSIKDNQIQDENQRERTFSVSFQDTLTPNINQNQNQNQQRNSMIDFNCILSQLKTHAIIEIAEISKFNEYSGNSIEFFNFFPGGKLTKKRKRKKSSSKKLFSEIRSAKSGKSHEDLNTKDQKRLSVRPIVSDENNTYRSHRRSRSFKYRLRTKSKIFRAEEISQTQLPTITTSTTTTTTANNVNIQLREEKSSRLSLMKNSNLLLSTKSLRLHNKQQLIAEFDLGDVIKGSESSDSLEVSSDELSFISSCSDDNKLSDHNQMYKFYHSKKKKDHLTLKLSQNLDFIKQNESFCWFDESNFHIIDNSDFLFQLSFAKLQKNQLDKSFYLISEKEKKRRILKFLEMYKCGSLLRTLFQMNESLSEATESLKNADKTARRQSAIIFDQQALQRSRSDGNINKPLLPRRVEKLRQPKAVPIFSSDDESDEDSSSPGIPGEDEPSTETVHIEPGPRKASAIHLQMDTIDDMVNQINFSNPIKPSPRRRKTMM